MLNTHSHHRSKTHFFPQPVPPQATFSLLPLPSATSPSFSVDIRRLCLLIMSLSSISGKNLGDPTSNYKMQAISVICIFHFRGFWSSHLLRHFYSNITFVSITNNPNSLVSTWSWSCLNVFIGFTLSIQSSLFGKISNSGIGPVPSMVEVDTTRPSRPGIDRDFEPWSHSKTEPYSGYISKKNKGA